MTLSGLTQDRYTKPAVGEATVIRDATGRIHELHFWVDNKLESFRLRRHNSQNVIEAGRRLKRTKHTWYVLLNCLGTDYLTELQRQSALAGVKLHFSATVYRKRFVRDTMKNLTTALDHYILDALVGAKVLIDDDDGNLIWSIPMQEKPDQRRFDGRDCVFLRFAISTDPCRQSITERVKRNGWPDPHFREKKVKGFLHE